MNAAPTTSAQAGAGWQLPPAVERYGLAAFALLMLLLPLAPVPDFWIAQSITIGLYAMVALGLVLLTGVAGLTSFGQAAFVGVGAYATAYLATAQGWSPWLALPVGLLLALAAALLLGALTLRMSGHYLPLATIAWGLALYYTMGNLQWLGKYDGLQGVPTLSLFGLDLGTGRLLHPLVWACALAAALAVLRLLDSRSGRAIRALKSGATMPESLGMSTFRYKLLAFVIAALLAALSGFLFAHFQRTVNPTPFSLGKGIEFLFMAVLGGVGQVWGAFVGSAVVRVIEDQLQVLLPKLIGTSGNFEVVVFGVILVLLLKYAPDGLWAFVRRLAPQRQRPRDWASAAALPRREQPRRGEALLELDRLSKRFGGLVAVNELSFRIDAGQIVALIGPNGAGKSTSFNLITGVLPSSGGSLKYRGQRIDGWPSRAIASLGILRTFQHVKLVPDMTVLENVALGAYGRGSAGPLQAVLRLDRAEERQLFAEAERQLQRIGLAERMHELAGNLALGPQRLVEIARALAGDPQLLLLDEPAAGLRHAEKRALAALLEQLRAEGLSILLVEHDMDFVMGLADRVVVMEFGQKLIEGTPDEVQASPAVRAAYLGTEH